MDRIMFSYKVKGMIDNEIERDINKLSKKHGFVFVGSGWDTIREWRDVSYSRQNKEEK